MFLEKALTGFKLTLTNHSCIKYATRLLFLIYLVQKIKNLPYHLTDDISFNSII